MIGYVRGQVTYLAVDNCFVDVNGVGYRVYIANTTRAKLAVGKEVQLFTYLNVRDDAMLLYGFYTQNEYDLFLQLISVSGIGPKVALGIMSAITVDSLCLAIQQKKVTVLTKLPGIGKKTAERLILELHDKMNITVKTDDAEALLAESASEVSNNCVAETVQALMALGYTQAEITPILKKAPDNLITVEDMIKYALKAFSGR